MAGIQRFGRRRLRKKRGERILSKKLVAAAVVVVVLLGLNCRRSFISKKTKKSAQNPNLEDQNHKGLTLDPHKNYHQDQTHLQFHPQNSRNVGNNEGKDHPFLPQFDPSYHHFYLQPELYSQLDTQNLGPILENQEHIVKKRSHLPSSSSAECTQHVRQKSSMGNSDGGVGVQLFQQQEEEEQVPVPVTTRSALRRAGVGEIVEVQGGHIVRATGRKDRHSKVCTAKGPRDRRVRLSAHTAIQFYDVQDRLGYDRPSKAVDWLIKKAKASIDELDQLPAWSPTSMNMTAAPRRRGKGSGAGKVVELGEQDAGEDVFGDAHHKQQQQQLYGNGDNSGASLLPPSLDSDAIADTIKSFFPMGGGASAASTRPQMLFQDYRHGGDGSGGGGGLLSRSGGSRQSQDLRLSLQSFQVQDPIMMHSHNHQSDEQQQQQQQQQQQHSVFAGAAPVGYENPNVGWAESEHQPSPELGRLQRLVVDWQNQHQNSSMDRQHHHHHHHHSGSGGVGLGIGGGAAAGGFMFNQTPLLQPLFGGQHSQFFTQRGPLQSSNTPSVRAWISDPSIATTSEQQQQHLQAISVHPQGLSGLGYPSGGFSGFHIPARIQGDEEHDGDLKPSSASSGSHH